MAAGLQVFGQPASTDVARVLTCLFEKNLEFELVRTDTFKKSHKLPEFIKLRDPTGQVTFKHGDKTIVDSRAICRYLCTQFPDDGYKKLYGTGSLERASIEQWLQAEGQSFDAPSSELVFHLAFAPHLKDVRPDEARVAEKEKKLHNMLAVYDDILSKNEYLAGDDFTLADLSHLPNSHYIVNSSDRGRKLFTARKHVARWYDKISTRDSWRQVIKMQREHPGSFE